MKCSWCKKDLPAHAFYINKSSKYRGRSYYCKSCSRIHNALRRLEDDYYYADEPGIVLIKNSIGIYEKWYVTNRGTRKKVTREAE